MADYVKLLLVSLACVVLLPARAASAQAEAHAARKVMEFGDVLPTDIAARLDNFAIEVLNAPDARAFLVVYRSRRDLPGLSDRLANWMRAYLIHNRGLEPGRVVAIDGGAASCVTHELWLVPPGTAPQPRPDAYSRSYVDTDVARKFDEYHFTTLDDVSDSLGVEYEGGLSGFAAALRKEPRALGFIIAYEGYRVDTWRSEDARGRAKTERRVHRDPPGTAWKELRGKRDALVKSYGVPASRIRLLVGGYRKWRQLEFWIVPDGALAPVPTPNVAPPPRRRR